ncbi:MAG: toll/interleukin-1 receptor domain-containing protein [Eubacterium sp.]|nr:toll/interleukin-1 receptor domain-containing protein [Eubacterium sp.]
MSDLSEIHYDAFISYRHIDRDSYVAKSIHKKLESFKLPGSVRKKTGSEKTAITRVFRDEEELPLSSDLSEPINQALINSEFLICVCTPEYLSSRWCLQEVETFLQNHDHSHILVVLAKGEPSEAFPEILTYEDVEVQTEDGATHLIRKTIEPLGADVRGESKKETDKKIDTAVMRLAAAIFGLNFDDLKQRHREARLKRILAMSACIGVCLLAFGIYVTVSLVQISRQNDEINIKNQEISKQNQEISKQNITISDQYTELQDKYASQIAETSKKQLALGRRKNAISALRSVLPDDDSKPYNPDAVAMLYDAMNTYEIDNHYTPAMTYDMDMEVIYFHVSYDAKYIMVNDYLNMKIFDVESGDIIAEYKVESTEGESFFNGYFCGSKGYIIVDGGECIYHSLVDDTEKKIDALNEYASFYRSDDGTITLAVFEGTIIGIDNDGDILYKLNANKLFKESDLMTSSVCFDSGRFMCMFNGEKYSYVVVADEKNGHIVYTGKQKYDGQATCSLYKNKLCYSILNIKGRKPVTDITMIDIKTGNTLWNTPISEYMIGNVFMDANYVYITGEMDIATLNAKTGKLIKMSSEESLITTSWIKNGYFYYLLYNGKLNKIYKGVSYEADDPWLEYQPENPIQTAIVNDKDVFYVSERAGYVVRQTQENAPGSELIGKEYEEKFVPDQHDGTLDALDVLKDSSDVDINMIDNACFSQDEKLIFAYLRDNTSKIIDASTLKVLQTLEIPDETWFAGLRFSELTGTYILDSMVNSYILDKDYHILCKTGKIVDETDDSFIMFNYSGDYYKVPYVPYNELIRRADEMLAE